MLKAELPDLAELNDVAADIARSQAAELLVGASKTKKAVIRSLIRRSLDEGWSDTVLQARIAEKAGLDPRSAQALESYRAGLKANNVPPGRAARQVEAYRKRLLRNRASVIATTETQQALLDAQRAIWAHQQQNGDLSPYAVRVTVTHKDDRLCVTCRPQGGRRHSLKSKDGGPPFHPRCRCFERVEDEGVVKSDPQGSDLYVPDATMIIGPTPAMTKKRRKKKRRDGRLVGMDDVTKVSSRVYPSLERKKGGPDNWVEASGGLPSYIERIAKHLHYERKMPIGRAIAVAVSRCRLWAGGGGNVDPDTKAKAAKAIAEWEAKKAKAHARSDD